MPSRSLFRRHDSQPRTPPRPSTSPSVPTSYSPFRRQPLGRSDLPSTPESPGIGPTTPSASNTPNGNHRAPSRTWSVGSIPIVFDPSSPRPNAWNLGHQQLPTSTGDSPIFPSGVGSISNSPRPNQSPQAFGYSTGPTDDPASPLGSAAGPSSGSPVPRRRLWKGRFGMIEEATPAVHVPGSIEDSKNDDGVKTHRAIVGLGVEAPSVDALASPIVPHGSPRGFASRLRSAKSSAHLSPYASPDPSSLHPDDRHLAPRHSHYDHDDDDATSIFSLSAYYDPPGPDSPSVNNHDGRFDQHYLPLPKNSSPALGPAISFDALPRLTGTINHGYNHDPFPSTEPRRAREASGHTARPLGNICPKQDQPLPGSPKPSPSAPQKEDAEDGTSDKRDSVGLESAPLSAFSSTADSSRSYSSLSATSISTHPTEVTPSSSCGEPLGSDDGISLHPEQGSFISLSGSNATSAHDPSPVRCRSSSVTVPTVGTSTQQDAIQHLATSSSLGSVISTPRTHKNERPHPTPSSIHIVTPETPITFAQHSGVITPPFSSLFTSESAEDRPLPPPSDPPALFPQQFDPSASAFRREDAGQSTPTMAPIDRLSQYRPALDEEHPYYAHHVSDRKGEDLPRGAFLSGQAGPYDGLPGYGGNLQQHQGEERELKRAISPAASGTGSPRTSHLSGSNYSVGSRSFVNVNLPAKIAFLKDTIVELHIDQEGFRGINPRFHLHRHTYNTLKPSYGREYALLLEGASTKSVATTSSASFMTHHSRSGSRSSAVVTPSTPGSCFEDDLYGEYGLAEFRMSSRDIFVFHHAKFDGPPTLRRVTINGDDSKDYISREASLWLKENGVYTVQGWEDKGKLFWKMEYLVDDRKAANGLEVHGEKTFSPLTFFCSPLLLDPERGKKIGMFQVVKKSITPKISSSKLRPPRVAVSPTKSRIVSAGDGRSKITTVESASPPVPPLPPRHQTPAQLLSHTPSQGETLSAEEATLAKLKGGGVRSAFSKVLSRPSTPGRPSTPKRPKTPTKRPSTASKAIIVSAPSPADELADPFAKLAPSNFTASDWARRAANATANRPRAASAAAHTRPLLASTPLDYDFHTLPSLANLGTNGSRANTSDAPRSLNPATVASRRSSRPSLPPPHVPGPIVPHQQIEQWMSDAQKSESSLPLPPPRTSKPPKLPKRPSTAATDGRPWNKI